MGCMEGSIKLEGPRYGAGYSQTTQRNLMTSLESAEGEHFLKTPGPTTTFSEAVLAEFFPSTSEPRGSAGGLQWQHERLLLWVCAPRILLT